MRRIGAYRLANAIAPRAISSSTNAAPIVVTTAAAHGYSTGDRVTIFGHATNTSANGTWVITVLDADEFSLNGSSGVGIGSNTGVHAIAAKSIFVQDANHVRLTFDTDGGGDASFTVKVAGSLGDESADYAAPQSVDNQYEYVALIDDEDGSPIEGDVGFIVATGDDHRSFTVNSDALDWLSVVPTAGTQGELTVNVYLYAIE